MKSKRRARRKSKQRSAEHRSAEPPPASAFTDADEAFFAAGVEASESGVFDGIPDDSEEAPRPGLLKRFLLRVQRA